MQKSRDPEKESQKVKKPTIATAILGEKECIKKRTP